MSTICEPCVCNNNNVILYDDDSQQYDNLVTYFLSSLAWTATTSSWSWFLPFFVFQECALCLTEPLLTNFLSVLPKVSFVACWVQHRVQHNGPVLLTLLEVCGSGGVGVADDLAGPHHALLPHPKGRRSSLLGLLCCGVSWGAEDPCLHPACLHWEQWVESREKLGV